MLEYEIEKPCSMLLLWFARLSGLMNGLCSGGSVNLAAENPSNVISP
jgi:hypothetical protein